jgi:hypothetical protein
MSNQALGCTSVTARVALNALNDLWSSASGAKVIKGRGKSGNGTMKTL